MIRPRIETVEGVEFQSLPLLVCDATDLLAEMLAVIAPGAGQWDAGATKGDAIGQICKELVGGKLTTYLIRILANTTMIVRGEGAGKWLLNSREALNNAFEGRGRYLPYAVKLAAEVSFKDFLGGLVLAGIKIPKIPKKGQPSEDSSQSTAVTG